MLARLRICGRMTFCRTRRPPSQHERSHETCLPILRLIARGFSDTRSPALGIEIVGALWVLPMGAQITAMLAYLWAGVLAP